MKGAVLKAPEEEAMKKKDMIFRLTMLVLLAALVGLPAGPMPAGGVETAFAEQAMIPEKATTVLGLSPAAAVIVAAGLLVIVILAIVAMTGGGHDTTIINSRRPDQAHGKRHG